MQKQTACCFGEILWDVLPAGSVPGGAPMNVAYHLQCLGIDTSLITRIGNDSAGRELAQILSSNGIPVSAVQVDEAQPTGLVYATPTQKSVQYDIVQPSAWDFIKADANAVAAVRQAEYFIYGSLAARQPVSQSTLYQLLEHAHTKVFDINLRPPHYQKEVLEVLLSYANILKLNDEEIIVLSQMFAPGLDEGQTVRLLQQQFNIKEVLVTRGSQGAACYTGENYYAIEGIAVTVADTLGSGDAFLAAYLAAKINGATAMECLKAGNERGAEVACKHGSGIQFSK